MKSPMFPLPTPPTAPPRRHVKAEALSKYLVTLLAGEELKGTEIHRWGGAFLALQGVLWEGERHKREGLMHLHLGCHYLSM